MRDADLVYAKQAEERWRVAEAGDSDLIEAGVERLGDLVATEWFEKNARDGAVSEVMKSDDTQFPFPIITMCSIGQLLKK